MSIVSVPVFMATVALSAPIAVCGSCNPYGLECVVTDGMTVEKALDTVASWEAENLAPDTDTDVVLVQDSTDFLNDGHADSHGYSQVFKDAVESIPFTGNVVDWENGTEFITVTTEYQNQDFGGSWNLVETDGCCYGFDVYGADLAGDGNYLKAIFCMLFE